MYLVYKTTKLKTKNDPYDVCKFHWKKHRIVKTETRKTILILKYLFCLQ